jgi:hypothetical protein
MAHVPFVDMAPSFLIPGVLDTLGKIYKNKNPQWNMFHSQQDSRPPVRFLKNQTGNWREIGPNTLNWPTLVHSFHHIFTWLKTIAWILGP